MQFVYVLRGSVSLEGSHFANALQCFRMLQNALDCIGMLQNASQGFRMCQNVSDCIRMMGVPMCSLYVFYVGP